MKKPHIIFVVCHDLGRHLGCYGRSSVASPNLDRFAGEGVRFDNCFCSAPQCTPSRAALFTGRYPHTNGVLTLASKPNRDERFLENILHDNGYETVRFGLVHHSADPNDELLLFDRRFPEISNVAPARHVAGYFENYIAKRKNREQPLYSYLGFFEPHRPNEYGGVTAEKETDVFIPNHVPDIEQARKEFALYQAAVRELDTAVGRVLNAVSSAGISEETLVIFTTDHGIPFPRAKATLYDPGIEVALQMRYPPAGLAGGKVIGSLVSNIDVLPTILDIAGIPVPEEVQGRSFLPLFTGTLFREREEVFAEKTQHNYYDPMRCIRTENYKLIYNFEGGHMVNIPGDAANGGFPWAYTSGLAGAMAHDLFPFRRHELELYDLEKDPNELNNLADTDNYRDIQHDLLSRLYRWMAETDDPILHGPIATPKYLSSIQSLHRRIGMAEENSYTGEVKMNDEPLVEFDFPDTVNTFTIRRSVPFFGIHIVSKDRFDIWVDSTECNLEEVRKEDSSVTILMSSYCSDGSAVFPEVRFTRQTDEVEAVISVRVEGEAEIRRIRFPQVIVNGVTPQDTLLVPTAWGDEIERPTRAIKDIWASTSYGLGQDYVLRADNEIIYTYPSILAMQFMTIYNTACSTYIARYGTGDETITMNARTLGKYVLELSVNHYPFAKNRTWKSESCSISMLGGGWKPAADLYRKRIGHVFGNPDLPVWMQSTEEGFHGWVQIMMKMQGAEPEFRYKDLLDVYEIVRTTGIQVLHVGGWCAEGFDMMYPDYLYNPELGSESEMREVLAEIRKRGGRVIFYTNGRLVDPDSQFYRNGGDSEVIVDEAGNPFIEEYPYPERGNTSPAFRIACPSSKAYRDYYVEQVRRIVGSYGAHGIQIDQISCNYLPFCHNTDHDHSKPSNNSLPGTETMLEEVRKAHREISPEFFTWIEGCHERYGRYYDIEQGHGEEYTWAVGKGKPELFSYVFPKRVVTGLCYDIQSLCFSFVQGKPLDAKYRFFDVPDYTRLLRDFVDVRKKCPEYYLRGEFAADLGVLVLENGIRAFRIISDGGSGSLIALWVPGADVHMDSFAHLSFSENMGGDDSRKHQQSPAQKSFRVPDPSTAAPIYPENLSIDVGSELMSLAWTGAVGVFTAEHR